MKKPIIMEKFESGYGDGYIQTTPIGSEAAAPPILLHRLLDISGLALAELEVDHVLTAVMNSVIEIYGAERGMIVLFDQGGEIMFEATRNLSEEDHEHPKFEVSRTMIDEVRKKGVPICHCHALAAPTSRKKASTGKSSIVSAICLPLRRNSEVFGAMYLDNQTVSGGFEPNTCVFFKEFASFISLAAYHALERKQLHNRVHTLEAELRGKYHFESIVGHHSKMVEIMKLVAQIADTDATVLIQGESGTGKELIARALHYNSRHKSNLFVPINCGALPENLLESELFGHVRGAFTGAIKDKAGWFERADGGTIFLDEVSEMTPTLQVKLLRILQTGEYSWVGSTEIRHCDVRVVAATNKNLQKLVEEGTFREDLYYRLNVLDIELPPLRDRKCDIPILTQHFLKIFGTKYGKENLHLSRDAEILLLAYDFPGNVRELENIVQRAVVLSEDEFIEPPHLPPSVYREWTASALKEKKPSSFKVAKQHAVEQFERGYITDCLKSTRGNISRAAQVAGVNVKNFYEKMTKYDIDPHSFKKPLE